MRGFSTKKRVFIFLTAVVVAFWFSSYFSSPGSPDGSRFVVGEGEGVDSIVNRLAEDGFIRSRPLFRWSLSRSGLATRIQPGPHDLAGVRTYYDIIDRLASGGVAAHEVTLLVREGETLRDIRATLGTLGAAVAAEGLYSVTGAPAEYPAALSPESGSLADEYPFLAGKPDDVGLEGYLFPDTYRIYRDASAEDVVRRMLDNFADRMTPELLGEVKASGRSFHEVIIMASIIEREVRGSEERRMVADIFWRRLDEGMRLQADSTVNYVTGKRLPSVSYDDTRYDSPYNTYRYAGLPPGPIGNPGIEAIEAALDPEPNDFWYFLTDEEGTVHYARTFDEHNQNKYRYLK